MLAEPEYLSRKEAAAYLRGKGIAVAPKTLQNWACNNNQGKGPAFIRIHWQIVRYRRADLDAWIREQSVRIS